MTRQLLPRINFVFILVASFIIIIFQSTLFHILFKSFRPDILLLLIIYLSFHRYIIEGGVLSLLIGWIVEAYCGVPHGLMMTVYLWVFLISKMVGLAVFLTKAWGTLLVVTMMGLLQNFLVWGLSLLFFQENPSLDAMMHEWFPTLIIQLIATPIIFGFFEYMDRICNKESPSKITGVLGTQILAR